MSNDQSPTNESFHSSEDSREIDLLDDSASIEIVKEFKDVYACFDFAISEFAERGKKMSKDLVARAAVGDYYLKGTDYIVSEDFAKLSLMSRSFDLILVKICGPDSIQGESFIYSLTEFFSDRLLTVSEVQTYHAAITEHREARDFCSGGESDPLCSYIHIPRSLRWLMYTNDDWKAFNFNKEKALVRHLLTEYPVADVIEIYELAKNAKTTISVKKVSFLPRIFLTAGMVRTH